MHGNKTKEWINLVEQGKFEELVYQLLTVHYDPAYKKVFKGENKVREIQATKITEEAYEELAKQLLEFTP